MDSDSALSMASALETYLNPSWLLDSVALRQVSQGLMERRLIVIHNALQESFAERMFRCLNEFSDWKLYETYSARTDPDSFGSPFNYRHHNIYDKSLYPKDLARCQGIFCSDATRRFIQQLSGQDCGGGTSFSASWYQPGDHSCPHNDRVLISDDNTVRNVAFVWHLTKGWRAQWGGALYWCPKNRYVPPSFNTLSLFVVNDASAHFVTPVSPQATAKRLSINGWWSGKASPDQTVDLAASTGETHPGIEII